MPVSKCYVSINCDCLYILFPLLTGASPGFRRGRGQEIIFFQIWEAMRIARGVRGHDPPRKLFKTMQFGAF